ncbi:hypothetical protein OBBRIDRAFT_725920 [Obba rivulosa]|uniref:Uncharacterized protein n=1 Tax=Obba rivulosa TaxID=1052685 RepID=A0A8E2B623_9APHY|nr:hypothetical protein OBBRIDRAFT_725920 [Obba rivulosa]
MGNQYVDVELLRGVSLGFGVPVITKSFAPMQGPIPNVVALPYGKAPPFHILAPTWRGMLKLMARCASTRVEPTIEATALVKTPMKLRIVICFVKVHQSSTEWQTILFMTIDYAVPKGTQGWKHRIADPNTLPWSYTLSPPLAILRDGADAPMSKYYCVPSTQETPYPTLPITFPDLATYLTAVLEDSRRAMNDSSSGMRRLAKAIDTFYPNETPTDASEDRPGVRQKLLSFVGMGSKPQRDRNADTYELVTPFVPDDFGG